jgi:hypothetical protein
MGLGTAAAATAGFGDSPNLVQLGGMGLASLVAAMLTWRTEIRSSSPTETVPVSQLQSRYRSGSRRFTARCYWNLPNLRLAPG